ncbi:MAG: DNA-binding protein WhiA [Peptococcaceae bacterium]|nr:DNA-binding protein WhiA [Peptococcaceae bacterium]
MSFSAQTKNELARVADVKNCCKTAELSALFRMDGSIQISGRQVYINIRNENAAVARKIFSLIREIFGVQPEVLVQRKSKLRKNNVYMVRVPPRDMTGEILVALGLMDENRRLQDRISPDFLKRECCRRAYLRGTFLGGGSVNSPGGGTYHLEVITNSESHARDIRRLFRRFKLDAKINSRKNWYVIYLKESEQIVSCLNIMGAHQALLDFENKRIMKDMKNQVNRLVNCETANLNKTVNAAVQQLESIRRIKASMGLDKLPPSLRQVAEARINNPHASLRELGEMLDPKVGKSGVSHRLRKIEELARKV